MTLYVPPPDETDTEPLVPLPPGLLETDAAPEVPLHVQFFFLNFGQSTPNPPIQPPGDVQDSTEASSSPLPLSEATGAGAGGGVSRFQRLSDSSLLELHGNLRLFLVDAVEFTQASPTGPQPIFAWQPQAEADLTAMSDELRSRHLT